MFNRNSLIHFLIFAVVMLGVFLIYEGYQTYLRSEESELKSCISSLQGYLADSLKREEIKKKINPSKEWKILNNAERELLFTSLDINKRFNCGKSLFFVEGKFQNKDDLEIMVRQTDYGMEVLIKSLQ